MKKLLLGLMAITFSWTAMAGDASTFTDLGFSADEKYYSFMQYGEQDGSGTFYVQVDIVEVKSNKLAKRVMEWGNEEGETEIPRNEIFKKAYAKANFKKFGYTQMNRGTYLLVRPNTDFSSYTNTLFSREYWAQGGASTEVQKYSLQIQESVAQDSPEYCWEGAKLLELKMVWKDRNTSQVKSSVLQKDQKLPESRACAYDYSVQFVIGKGDKMVTIVRYKQTGFEGPDYRYIAVTGEFQ